MKNCVFHIRNMANDGKDEENTSIFPITRLGNGIDVGLPNTFLSTEIAPYGISTNNNSNNNSNRTGMAIHNSDLDLISNWKTVSNEQENGMATSAYIGIHVGIGLIGVVLNG